MCPQSLICPPISDSWVGVLLNKNKIIKNKFDLENYSPIAISNYYCVTIIGHQKCYLYDTKLNIIV